MKILVTGGAGFIGSHIVERFQGKAEVRVLNNWQFKTMRTVIFLIAGKLDFSPINPHAAGRRILSPKAPQPTRNSKEAPKYTYVASLINAIMRSPDWSRTAIFLSWGWGGFYDHVVPPQSTRTATAFASRESS
jgi:hypothetical protein